MEFAASVGDLGGRSRRSRHAWPVAVRRACRTAAEALSCARGIRKGPSESDARQRAAKLVDACRRLAQSMELQVDVYGQVPDSPCVIVANHLSYLDPLAIGQTVPVGAVAKSEIMSWPGVGEAVADLGIVFVKRGSARSGAIALRKMMRLLDSGVSVLVFPEGTTTVGHDVLPFSRGAFGAARLTRAPVVPVTVRYESTDACWVGDASLIPHVVQLHRFREVRAELIFGPSLQPFAFTDATELAEATRQCIRSVLLP